MRREIQDIVELSIGGRANQDRLPAKQIARKADRTQSRLHKSVNATGGRDFERGLWEPWETYFISIG
jgi:hypothetical protein